MLQLAPNPAPGRLPQEPLGIPYNETPTMPDPLTLEGHRVTSVHTSTTCHLHDQHRATSVHSSTRCHLCDHISAGHRFFHIKPQQRLLRVIYGPSHTRGAPAASGPALSFAP